MLNGSYPILPKEHRYFFAVAFIGLGIRVVEILAAFVIAKEGETESFGIYSIFDHWELMSPFYCILAFSIIIVLVWKIRPGGLILALVPILLLAYFFDYWFVDSQMRIREAKILVPNFEYRTFDFILLSGSLFDVISLVIANLLIAWNVSIIYRLVQKNRRAQVAEVS